MRPVNRGSWPAEASRRFRVFAEYSHARPFLIDNLGDYCSFCEIPMPTGLAVEHIRHKDGNPELEKNWTNFLLACPSCNSTKSTKVSTEADVEARLWPHLDRTFDIFEYDAGGIVRLVNIDDPKLAARARATEEMVQLQRRPGNGFTLEQDLSDSDRRWEKRLQVWDEAHDAREDLRRQDNPIVRHRILRLARACGFWSVWMTVFCDDEEMLRDLCSDIYFPGTATDRVYPLPGRLVSK